MVPKERTATEGVAMGCAEPVSVGEGAATSEAMDIAAPAPLDEHAKRERSGAYLKENPAQNPIGLEHLIVKTRSYMCCSCRDARLAGASPCMVCLLKATHSPCSRGRALTMQEHVDPKSATLSPCSSRRRV
jgi:hypothetical protein